MGPSLDNIQTEVYELNLCEQLSDMGNGFGIGGTLTTGLSKDPDNANTDI